MDVYISYTEKDIDIALNISKVLCKNDFTYILSQSKSPKGIERNIKTCDEFLLKCSNSKNRSELVLQEIKIALEMKKYICIFTVEKPILLDKIDSRLSLYHQIKRGYYGVYH